MTTAFVLGNGISRQGLDLNELSKIGPIYGCNALYRDFAPAVLVATDTPISETIQNSGYALTNCFYTRHPIQGLGANLIPEEYWKYSSGPVAIALAAEQGHKQIYLLGFDMGPNSTGHFNNVYASTEFYKKAASVPTYTGNWANQIVEVTKRFSDTQFIRVVGDTTADIKQFNANANISHCQISEFQKRINNTKDL